MGLSRDDVMGDDSVMECVPEGGVIRTYSSWNNPRPTIGNTREDVVSYGLLYAFQSMSE